MACTGSAERAELWRRLEAYEFDRPGTVFTFAQRLARESGWSTAFAVRAIEEYKRFAFLCMCEPPATPSFQADQVWHLHLTFTRGYWEDFCGEVLRRPLHHNPTLGGPSEHEKHWYQYVATLQAYEAHFGAWPPRDVWPPPSLRFGENLEYCCVNAEHYWIVYKPAPMRALMARARQYVQLATVAAAKAQAVTRAARTSLGSAGRLFAGSGFTLVALTMACSFQTTSAAEEGTCASATPGAPARNDFLGGLSGEAFLGVYCFAALASFCAGAALRDLLRESKLRATSAGLGPYDLAVLSGDGDAEASLRACVCTLVQRGALQALPGRGRRIVAAREAASRSAGSGARALERAVVSACTFEQVYSRVAANSEVKDSLGKMTQQLTRQGLLMSRGASSRVSALACAPGVCVVLCLGVPRLLGANGRPTEILRLLMVATALLTLLLFWAGVPAQLRTKAGGEVLEEFRRRHGHLKGGVQSKTQDEDVALAFAIFGYGAVASGSLLQSQLQPLIATNDRGGEDGGDSWSGDSGRDGCSGCGG